MAVADVTLTVKVRGDGSAELVKVGKGVKDIGEESEKSGKKIAAMTAVIGGAAVAAGGLVAAFKSVQGVLRQFEQIDSITKMSREIGVAVETVSSFTLAAQLSGTSTDIMARGMRNLARNATQVVQGTGEARSAFDALKISVENASGGLKSGEELMLEIADAFSQAKDGAEKTAIAMKAVGEEAGPKLINFLNQGAVGIKAMIELNRDLGLSFTEAQGALVEGINDNLTILGLAFDGIKRQFALGLAPALSQITGAVVEFAKAAAGPGQAGARGFAQVIGGSLVAAVDAGLAALEQFLRTIEQFGLGEALGNLFRGAFEGIGTFALQAGAFIAKQIGIGILQAFPITIGQVLKGVRAAILSVFGETVGGSIVSGFGIDGEIEALVGYVQALEDLRGEFPAFVEVGKGSEAIGNLADAAAAARKSLGEFKAQGESLALVTLPKLEKATSGVGKSTKAAGASAKATKEAYELFATSTGDALSRLVSDIESQYGSLAGTVTLAFGQAFDGVIAGTNTFGGVFKSALTRIMRDSVSGAVGGLVGQLTGLLSDVGGSVLDAIGVSTGGSGAGAFSFAAEGGGILNSFFGGGNLSFIPNAGTGGLGVIRVGGPPADFVGPVQPGQQGTDLDLGGALGGIGAGIASGRAFEKKFNSRFDSGDGVRRLTTTDINRIAQDSLREGLKIKSQIVGAIGGAVTGALTGGAGGAIGGSIFGLVSSGLSSALLSQIDLDTLEKRKVDISFDPLLGGLINLFGGAGVLGLPTRGTAFRRAAEKGIFDESQFFGEEDGLQSIFGDITRDKGDALGLKVRRNYETGLLTAFERGLDPEVGRTIAGATAAIVGEAFSGSEPKDAGRIAADSGQIIAEFFSRGITTGLDSGEILNEARTALKGLVGELGQGLDFFDLVGSAQTFGLTNLPQSQELFGGIGAHAETISPFRAAAESITGVIRLFEDDFPQGTQVALSALQSLENEAGDGPFRTLTSSSADFLVAASSDFETLVDLLQQQLGAGLEINVERFERLTEAASQSAQIVSGALSAALTSGAPQLSIDTLFAGIGEQVKSQFSAAIKGALLDQTAIGQALTPITKALQSLPKIDLLDVAQRDFFSAALSQGIAEGRANLADYIPLIKEMIAAGEEFEALIDEATEPSRAERFGAAIEAALASASQNFSASLSEALFNGLLNGNVLSAGESLSSQVGDLVKTNLLKGIVEAFVAAAGIDALFEKYGPQLQFVVQSALSGAASDEQVQAQFKRIGEEMQGDAEGVIDVLFTGAQQLAPLFDALIPDEKTLTLNVEVEGDGVGGGTRPQVGNIPTDGVGNDPRIPENSPLRTDSRAPQSRTRRTNPFEGLASVAGLGSAQFNDTRRPLASGLLVRPDVLNEVLPPNPVRTITDPPPATPRVPTGVNANDFRNRGTDPSIQRGAPPGGFGGGGSGGSVDPEDFLLRFSFGGGILDSILGALGEDDSLQSVIRQQTGQGILQGMVDTFLSGPLVEEIMAPLQEAFFRAADDGLISTAEGEALTKLGEEASSQLADAALFMSGPMQAVAETFGLGVQKEVEKAADVLSGGFGSALRSVLVDGGEADQAFQRAIFDATIGGMIEAFLAGELMQPALDQFNKLIAEGHHKAAVTGFKAFLESQEFQDGMDAISQATDDLREILPLAASVAQETAATSRQTVEAATQLEEARQEQEVEFVEHRNALGAGVVTPFGRVNQFQSRNFVPQLATGGFVTSDGLAFLHAGETVVPGGAGDSRIDGLVAENREMRAAMVDLAQAIRDRPMVLEVEQRVLAEATIAGIEEQGLGERRLFVRSR